MSKRGRPRKVQSLFQVKEWIEYTSDSDSDINNVQDNNYKDVQPPNSQKRLRNKSPTEHQTHVRRVNMVKFVNIFFQKIGRDKTN